VFGPYQSVKGLSRIFVVTKSFPDPSNQGKHGRDPTLKSSPQAAGSGPALRLRRDNHGMYE
jgi:hypothetical protein